MKKLRKTSLTPTPKGIGVRDIFFGFPSEISLYFLFKRRVLKQAKEYENLFAVVGIHPHDAKAQTQDDYLYFERVSHDEKVVALGEIGLDFYYDLSDREVQKRVFVEQLELAHSLKLPVVMHVRDAYGLALEILKE